MSETFGAWELLSRLGQNELGETQLARRSSDQRHAVLKRISREVQSDTAFYDALKAELALAAKLAHPNAAAVLEQGEIDGVAFVAMEHVEGLSLAHLIRAAQATGGWPMSMDRAASLMRPVLEALAAAHALSPPLLHRDLVPENVLVTREGRVVLADFGLGRARLRAGGGAGLRRAYVSPEQARGNATDPRSEVFAAGLMLFELVCGRLPALGGAGEVIARIATGELDAPLAVNPRIDDGAVAVLARALADRPEERFASARAFFEALAPWAAASQEEPLAAWMTRLSAVKVPVASMPPKPKELPSPAVTGVAAVPRPSPSRLRRALVAAAALALVGVASQLVEWKHLVGTTAVDPLSAGRPLELTTIPTGAQVFVDGVLEERRTPLTLHIPKDEYRTLLLKKPGVGTWSGIVYNSRKVEVELVNGELIEDRYEGQRPSLKEPVTQAAPVEPEEPTAPAPQEVVFDAEAPPLEVVLTRAHSIKVDSAPALELAAGDEVSLSTPLTVYLQPTTPMQTRNAGRNTTNPAKNNAWMAGMGAATFRALNLFALRVDGAAVEVFDLSRPVVVPRAGRYHFFSPTEKGDLSHNDAVVRVKDKAVALTQGHLLRVDATDSFLIRVLKPGTSYRLELTRADGQPGPLPVVLMSLRPDADHTQTDDLDETSMRYDGTPLPTGQAVVSAGVHFLSGARYVLFTIVTAEGIIPPDVKLSIRAASGKKAKPR